MFSIGKRPPGRHITVAHPAQIAPVPSVREVVNRLRAEWRRVARVLSDPAVELDADEFVSVLDVYRRLKAGGATIDPMAEALILQGMYRLVTIRSRGRGEEMRQPKKTNHVGPQLRPVYEVARLWNQRSGRRISRGRVWQILVKAEAKIARALKDDPDT